MKYILKLAGILLLITALVAGLLGFVNQLTAQRIADNTAEKANAAMQSVLPSSSYEKLDVIDSRITEAYRAEGGYVVRLNASGFGGAIDLMVGVSEEGTVTGVSIISHGETASLGAECTREDFRAQFIGAQGDLKVTKDGGTIDALTGATVTSRAVTSAVQVALEFVKEVVA
ncbi:MAG: RnfABCDGE type electron transport complex subunit G [Oscillospiraceae bacterium]|nr:RnfABCDGE type electron transport complex subunit G [Oscillospiraceae bacterium]